LGKKNIFSKPLFWAIFVKKLAIFLSQNVWSHCRPVSQRRELVNYSCKLQADAGVNFKFVDDKFAFTRLSSSFSTCVHKTKKKLIGEFRVREGGWGPLGSRASGTCTND
jgi:hypothetical protein